MNARKFRFVLCGLTLLTLTAIGAISYFGIGYLQDQVKETDRIKIEAEVNDEAGAYAFQSKQDFADSRIARLDTSLKRLIPDKKYREQFIADVKSYADANGVGLMAITFQDAAVSAAPAGLAPQIKGAKAIPIQLTFSGSVPYDNFITFMSQLENNLQHIQILSIDIAPDVDNRALLSAVNISLAVYVKE